MNTFVITITSNQAAAHLNMFWEHLAIYHLIGLHVRHLNDVLHNLLYLGFQSLEAQNLLIYLYYLEQ